MKKIAGWVTALMLVWVGFGIEPLAAEEIQVAVAANFAATMKDIVPEFEKETSHRAILSFGSTGKFYAQIKNGAPFEIFLAADTKTPLRLEQEGIAVSGSRYVYARGRLVLWSRVPGLVDSKGEVLKRGDFHYLALTNPKLAPYGQAAQQVLEGLGQWSTLQPKLVMGENLIQTHQYIMSGNAQLGFIAYSQIRQPGKAVEGSYWEIPSSLYDPIDQAVVILKDSAAVRQLWDYLRSAFARRVIQSYGYGVIE